MNSSGSLTQDARSSSSTEAGPLTFQPDLILECEGLSFACHEGVLVACSDVFRSKIEDAEKGTGGLKTVKITDMEPEILEMMLNFMYTNKLKRDGSGYRDVPLYHLLKTADEFKFIHLRNFCEDRILREVEVQLDLVRYAITDGFECSSSERFHRELSDLASEKIEDIADRIRGPRNQDGGDQAVTDKDDE